MMVKWIHLLPLAPFISYYKTCCNINHLDLHVMIFRVIVFISLLTAENQAYHFHSIPTFHPINPSIQMYKLFWPYLNLLQVIAC